MFCVVIVVGLCWSGLGARAADSGNNVRPQTHAKPNYLFVPSVGRSHYVIVSFILTTMYTGLPIKTS
jgi:hypothetical protein